MNIEQRFKNAGASKTFQRIMFVFGLRHKKVLDLGCGFGEQLALFGEGSVGVTTNMEEIKQGKMRGLDIVFGNIEELGELKIKNNFRIIWANNFFEHILSPHAFLAKLKSFADGDTELILGVPVVPAPSLLLRVRKFRGALASNHISFFTRKTLLLTVERSGWNISDARPFLVNYAPLDRFFGFFAPHLYVVAKKDETFKYGEKKLQEWRGVRYYSKLLESTGQL